MITFVLFSYFAIQVFVIQASANREGSLNGVYSDNDSTINLLDLPEVEVDEIMAAETRKIEEEKRLEEERKRQAIRQQHIDRIYNFLRRQGSRIATKHYAAIIYDRSTQVGADYRGILAVMGVESGFCNASFSYNCFGFLNGRRYSSFDQALNDLIPKVAQFTKAYGTNFAGFCKAYGIQNVEAGTANLSSYFYSV